MIMTVCALMANRSACMRRLDDEREIVSSRSFGRGRFDYLEYQYSCHAASPDRVAQAIIASIPVPKF